MKLLDGLVRVVTADGLVVWTFPENVKSVQESISMTSTEEQRAFYIAADKLYWKKDRK